MGNAFSNNPTLLIIAETSSTWPYQAPNLSPLMSTSTPLSPHYSVCRWTDFVVRILPTNYLASSSVASKMSHNAFDLLARIFGPRLFNAYTIVSLLTPVNFRLLTLVVSRGIVLVFTASITSGIVRNLFTLVYIPSYTFHLDFCNS